jgi:N-acetylmuramoyl-L-alanine amidase
MKAITKLFLSILVILTFYSSALLSEDSVKVNNNSRPDEHLNDYKEYQKPLGSVVDINVIKKGNTMNIVFTVTRSFMADVKVLNYPFRLMIDIPMPYDWKVDDQVLKNKVPLTFIQGFRYGNPAKNLFRIVADLGHPVSLIKAYVEKRQDGKYDFVIQMDSNVSSNQVMSANSIVFSDDVSVVKEISKVAEVEEEKSKTERNKLRSFYKIQDYLGTVKYQKPKNEYPERPVVILIDPGHGGKDPGAISNDRSLVEKDIVLDIALYTKKSLEEDREISVILSRSEDYYLPLKDRILWAQFFNVALFVSIHADKASSSDKSSGLSVYTLSDVASDNQTQLLANDANMSDMIAGVEVGSNDEEVNKILISLSQRVKVNESLILAKSIVDSAGQKVKILNNPLRSAGFAVLKVPNVPSVLVELGFLSNEEDVLKFKTPTYKEDIAKVLANAIENYLSNKGLISIKPKGL